MMNESYAQELDIRPDFVKMASPQNQKLWESLKPQQQALLESQASLRTLDTADKIDRFFETRDYDITIAQGSFVPTRPTSINESYDPLVTAMQRLAR